MLEKIDEELERTIRTLYMSDFLGEESKFGEEEERPDHDFFDEEDKYRLIVMLPGCEKEDINVEAGDNWIRIQATAQIDSSQRRYFLYRTFPCKIDSDRIRARYKNGVLELEIPKMQPSGRRIRIE